MVIDQAAITQATVEATKAEVLGMAMPQVTVTLALEASQQVQGPN